MNQPFFEDNGRFIIDTNLPPFAEAAVTLLEDRPVAWRERFRPREATEATIAIARRSLRLKFAVYV